MTSPELEKARTYEETEERKSHPMHVLLIILRPGPDG